MARKDMKQQGKKGKVIRMPLASTGIEAQDCKSLKLFHDNRTNNPDVKSMRGPRRRRPFGNIHVSKSFIEGIKGFDYSHSVFKYCQPQMSPTIIDGAVIGVDCDNWKLKENELYVLDIPGNEYLLVKRLIQIGPGWLLLGVDNPKYFHTVYQMEDVQIVGQVVWILNEDVPVEPANRESTTISLFGNIPFLEL